MPRLATTYTTLVIRAIASRDPDDTGPAETLDTPVTVTVTDVDEDGEVVISWLQPEVGIAIMASLTDADGPGPVDTVDGPNDVPDTTAIANATWTWEVSEIVQGSLDPNNEDHWGDAPGEDNSGNADQSYTRLEPPWMMMILKSNRRRQVPAGNGELHGPPWRYQDGACDVDLHGAGAGLGAKNQSPDFEVGKVDRSVAETAEVGADVETPVRAPVGGSSAIDRLTYSLRAVADIDLTGITGVTLPSGVGTGPDDDLVAFDIVKATGQITVAQKLDFESRGPEGNRDGKYVVVATVTDPSGEFDEIVVVITATDVNEDPVLSGRPELTIMEIDSGDEDADNPDFDGTPSPGDVNVYHVVDEDRRAATQRGSWRETTKVSSSLSVR